ncbi:hypothetical protein JL475_39140 [Streptomyces sp. M2CJ-2]|uniref:hypothetical protein n=1 Tax=Streptomyces sp. M2CJ-2 TaxID=2803948 RepID=UPI00192598A9|nr:hypothetical protein [Streptomyces sp. M2CJ-2]MBL3671754.1 hypothetical protein [Streptomyces sp. M2CJ-2]
MPLTGAETLTVERIVAADPSPFPYPDEESLCLYDDGGEPDEMVAGATKRPFDPGRILSALDHVLTSVTGLCRVLPGARWRVHMGDLDVPRDENDGYAFPGMRDAGLAAELGDL